MDEDRDRCELCGGMDDVQSVEMGNSEHIGMLLCAACRLEHDATGADEMDDEDEDE
jgi:hypothetical protein